MTPLALGATRGGAFAPRAATVRAARARDPARPGDRPAPRAAVVAAAAAVARCAPAAPPSPAGGRTSAARSRTSTTTSARTTSAGTRGARRGAGRPEPGAGGAPPRGPTLSAGTPVASSPHSRVPPVIIIIPRARRSRCPTRSRPSTRCARYVHRTKPPPPPPTPRALRRLAPAPPPRSDAFGSRRRADALLSDVRAGFRVRRDARPPPRALLPRPRRPGGLGRRRRRRRSRVRDAQTPEVLVQVARAQPKVRVGRRRSGVGARGVSARVRRAARVRVRPFRVQVVSEDAACEDTTRLPRVSRSVRVDAA